MSRKRILLVDDSSAILKMETYVLRAGPYDLITATSGEEAVGSAERDRPDLILLDVSMPSMGGFEACRVIRNGEATRSIPIIMVTTRPEASSVEDAWVSGCDDYLTKPINTNELLSKVRRFLGETSQEAYP